ncbi:acyl-CoA dehydrogenase family protein [Microbacterium tumbae]
MTARTHWTGTADRAENEHWRAIAERVAGQLAVDVRERERAGAVPRAEAELLRSSGLLGLLEPTELGGGGGHWSSAFLAVRVIARVDAGIAQLLGYHYANSANVPLIAAPGEREQWQRRSIEQGWLWGDSVNPVDPALTLTPEGEGYRLDGVKRFSTGSSVGDVILVNAVVSSGPDEGRFAFLVLPAGHPGVEVVDDWDFLGQRLSASNSVRFRDVVVGRELLLGFGTDEWFPQLLTPGIQLVFGNLYLGIAEGALAQARELTNARPNAWFLSRAERYRDDPFVQRLYGELVSRVAAVEALADRVNEEYDAVVARGDAVDERIRGDIEVRVAQLKVVSSDTAVDVANRVFEATGSSSTATKVGLDAHWRNVRTHSLHDPVDYKKLEVGADFLLGVRQPLSLYT